MKTRGPTPCPRGRAPYLVGPLELLRRQLQLYIFAFEDKKIKEKKSSRFTKRSRRQCNAPDSMRQVSASYSPSLPCHVLACCTLPCHHVHFISCHHVHRIRIRVRLMHPSIFPVVRFAIRRSYVARRPFLPFPVCGY